MPGSVNPYWNDSAVPGTFPPANHPTAASILGRFIHEVPDPNLDFHPEDTVQGWFRDGQQLFAAAAITNVSSGPKGKKGIPTAHALMAALLASSTAVNFTVDTPDVLLPDDCYLLLEAVLYPGTVDEAVCVEIPWEWDFRARNRRQYMPTSERPLVAIQDRRARFYVAGGIIAAAEYAFNYLRIPRGVFADPDDANKLKSDLPDPFNRGALSYTVGRWYASRETDHEPYLKEFAASLQATLPPEPEEEAS